MNLPVEIYSVASVKKIDEIAISDTGISGYSLMMRAGMAAFAAAVDAWPEAKRWQVICGSGNNAGDGYVVARLAAEQGIDVSVLALSPPGDLTGDAATACEDYVATKGVLAEFDGSLDDEADLLVDGLLGSGLSRAVEGVFASAIVAINSHKAPVLSLDMPSGIHGNSGVVMGVAVRADATVTFVGLKSGLFLNAGPDQAGRLIFSDLGIAAECREDEAPVLRRIGPGQIRPALPPRHRSAHKGDFGQVLVVGGGPGMPGAARICAEAALRSGAGLVRVATHTSHAASISSGCPELMCLGVGSAKDLGRLIKQATVIAIGPGLGIGAWAKKLFTAVVACDLPVVVDADALNLLAGTNHHRDDWILTPHPGEAARLLGSTPREVQDDRLAALSAIQARYGGTVILKGSSTLISSQNESPWLCCAGNPGMASPGMGDALTGIVAALRGQGLSQELAAVVATQVHAQAGDAAAKAGERGLVVTDLIAKIRSQVNP